MCIGQSYWNKFQQLVSVVDRFDWTTDSLRPILLINSETVLNIWDAIVLNQNQLKVINMSINYNLTNSSYYLMEYIKFVLILLKLVSPYVFSEIILGIWLMQRLLSSFENILIILYLC